MAANSFSANTGDRRRSDARLPPLPIPVSSFSASRQEPSPLLESPNTPFFEKRGPFYHAQTHDSFDSESQLYSADGGGRRNDSGPFSDNIPLRPHPEPDASELDLPQTADSELDKSLPGPVGERRRKKRREPQKKGLFQGRVPWVVYIFTLIQLTIFIVEMVKNAILTGSPIEIHPQVNPMLGPSIYVIINMGARYVPLPDPTVGGTLDAQPQPNQWFRFITPIFLHAGIVHIAFNMLLQLTLGREMEKEIGSLRFLLVYISSGIFGFVMGGNFAPNGIASTGASGALFGIIAVMLLDLLYTWNKRKAPGKELAFIILDIVISFVLGLLPGLDNFAHIGGFLMGLVLGICILHSPNALRGRVGSSGSAHDSKKPKSGQRKKGTKSFMSEPIGFFQGRKPLWWAWWAVRVAALVGVLVCFIVLLNNFYKYRTSCSWCKYLSCLVSVFLSWVTRDANPSDQPINNWCNIGYIQPQNLNSN
ncbi:hypothetical protein MMC13_007569 [Lambiella insularis]|nr:hypothetical protein [Lambiella insularis]